MKNSNSIFDLRITALLLLAFIFANKAHGQSGFELYGSRSEFGVQLYWECKAWPSNLQGFIIRRSEKGTNQWETISKTPVLPSIDKNIDYSSRGVTNPDLQTAIRTLLEKMLAENRITMYTAAELRSLLIEHNGLASGDRIRMKDNFYLALLMGFAFVDEVADPEKLYEYALHGYLADGSTSEDALGIFSMANINTIDINVDFAPSDNNIILEWEFPQQDMRAGSLLGFTISRRAPEDNEPADIVTAPFASYKFVDSIFEFRFVDRTADPKSDYIYYLYPANMFQQKGEPTLAYYISEKYQTPHPPQIKMVSLSGDQDMAVFWEIVPEDSLLISSLVLEVTTEPGNMSTLVSSDTMDGDFRWCLDKHPKSYGTMYYYQVRALTRYGRSAVSAPVSSYFLGQISPPPLKGLKGNLIRKGPETYVHMRWNPPDKGDTITEGFFIYSDELIPDSFLRISDLPLISENEYLFQITSQGGRDYRFRVAGVATGGKTGEPGEIIIPVGTLQMPEVYQIYPKLLKTGDVLITWRYPNIKDLKGFRLLMNGKELAGPDLISGDMRSYLFALPEKLPADGIRINIIAVGSLSQSGEGIQSKLNLPNHRFIDIPPPGILTYEVLPGDDNPVVQLCWDPPLGYHGDIEGYVFFMDYATPGRIQRINSVPVITGNSFLLTSGLKGREWVTVGIAAMKSDGTTGRVNEMKINLTNK